MKFSFKSFAIGFGCAALSIGAVTYASAAGDVTIKACANKTNGAMRYLAKGSCKKTETSLSWSQMGPQGLPGVAGPAGVNGAAGVNGSNGSIGPAGPSWKWVDANGNQLGDFIAYQDKKFMYNGAIYGFNSLISNDYSINYGNFLYTDASCTIAKGIFYGSYSQEVVYSAPANNPDATPRVWWQTTDVTRTIAGGDSFYRYQGYSGRTCTLTTVQNAPASDILRGAFYAEVVIYSGSPPTYVAPVRLVSN
jgi:hypothetical protein